MSLRRITAAGQTLGRMIVARKRAVAAVFAILLLACIVSDLTTTSSAVPEDQAALVADVATAQADHDSAIERLQAARKSAAAARTHHDGLLARSVEHRAAQPTIKQRMVENPTFIELDRKLAELEAKRKRMSDRLTDAHPDMQTLDYEIHDLQARLQITARLTADTNTDAAVVKEIVSHAAVNENLLGEIERARREIETAEASVRDAEQTERTAMDRQLAAERKLARVSLTLTTSGNRTSTIALVVFAMTAITLAVVHRGRLLSLVQFTMQRVKRAFAKPHVTETVAPAVPRRRAA